ncbi:MAG: polysaccharide pyruvyl transferase family protein [Gemmobacter sp.]
MTAPGQTEAHQLIDRLFGEAEPDLTLLDRDVPPVAPVQADVTGDLEAKLRCLMAQFNGATVLHWYHAGLIVHLRRDLRVAVMRRRFLDLWQDRQEDLLQGLSSRWLVSALDTFADHAETPADRAAAVGVSMAATLLRLAETERSGGAPHGTSPNLDGLTLFSVGQGDAILNLDQRLSAQAALPGASVPGRLADRLFDRMNACDTVLRRAAEKHVKQGTRWRAPVRRPCRIALFNDTSVSPHLGCRAVMTSLVGLVQNRGWGEVIHRHPLGREWRDDPAALRALEAADLIVVNGEGSVHHGNARAVQLSALGPAARDLGKPAVMLNATLEANEGIVAKNLAAFPALWVRDSRSAAWAASQGLSARVCPDLSLISATAVLPTTGQGGPVYMDCVIRPTTAKLARWARADRAVLYSLVINSDNHIMGLRRNRPREMTPMVPLRPCPRPEVLQRILANHSGLVTGRFHGACFGLLQRLPMLAVRSNTWKIEAMFDDIGLAPNRVLPDDADANSPPVIPPWTPAEAQAVEAYLEQARRMTAIIAKDLAALV